MKPGIKEFHAFLRGPFRKSIRETYEKYLILSEADLQAFAWSLIVEFFRENDPTGRRFRVLNKPYCKDLRIHPDLAVFKRSKPWVLVELKERRKLSVRSAKREWKRLIRAREHLCPKRAYLVYVARYGDSKALDGPKGKGARYFFELPIVLEDSWTRERIQAWEPEFKKWSKFASSDLTQKPN
ncbi:MAG: hypothetical protein ACRD5F_02990 [Candidatus Acidiferrales bacterium]